MKELAKAFAFLTILVLLGSYLANPASAQSFSSPKIGVQQISNSTIVDPSGLTAPLTIAPISATPGTFDAPTKPELDYRDLNPFSPGRRILESQGRIPSSVFGINSNPSNRIYADKFGSYPGQGAYQSIQPKPQTSTESQVVESWSDSPTFIRGRFRNRIQLRPFRGLFRR